MHRLLDSLLQYLRAGGNSIVSMHGCVVFNFGGSDVHTKVQDHAFDKGNEGRPEQIHEIESYS